MRAVLVPDDRLGPRRTPARASRGRGADANHFRRFLRRHPRLVRNAPVPRAVNDTAPLRRPLVQAVAVDGVRDIVRAECPDLAVDGPVRLVEGFEKRIAVISDDWLVRFPKADEAAAAMARERRLPDRLIGRTAERAAGQLDGPADGPWTSGSRSSRSPRRARMSRRFRAHARTRTRTSLGPLRGSGHSRYSSTPASPCFRTTAAFMPPPAAPWLGASAPNTAIGFTGAPVAFNRKKIMSAEKSGACRRRVQPVQPSSVAKYYLVMDQITCTAVPLSSGGAPLSNGL